MDVDNATDMGHRLRRIRMSRGKSLATVAGLAGISEGHLSRLERGERALDRRSLIARLATALEIAPQDLTALPVPATDDSAADTAVAEVRAAIHAVAIGMPDGQVQPLEQLSVRAHTVLDAKQRCLDDEVALVLPALIRDLHSSIEAGRNDAELLRLAVTLHHGGTGALLHGLGAPADLCWLAHQLAADAAERLDEPVSLGIAGFGMANALLSWGSFGLAGQTLRKLDVEPADDYHLSGMLSLTGSLLAAAESRPADSDAALTRAAELAARTGDGNAHYMSFGPTNVAMWRLSAALEAGDHERAAEIADGLSPEQIVAPTRRANYWVNYGRAMSRIRGKRDNAVRALREAEKISPDKVRRNPFARDTLAELLARAKQDAVGRELRALAYRSGLPV